ncbi:hypothetical protein Peur_033414 [Populus x canadensis]
MHSRIWDKKLCDRGFNQGLVPELEGAAGSMAETAPPCNSYWPVNYGSKSPKPKLENFDLVELFKHHRWNGALDCELFILHVVVGCRRNV